MMNPKRLSAKFYTLDPSGVDLEAIVPVFHRWIQDDALEGLLIDVADYAHVHQGPGILLIGHEGDYSLDLGEGRPGLLYTRKQNMPASLLESLNLTIRLALSAAVLAASEADLNGLDFDYSDIQLTFIDRLNTPNTQETFDALKDALQGFANDLYGKAEITLANNDSRDNLAIHIKTVNEVDPAVLLEKLSAGQPITN
jgi:hypothetical protein